MADDEIRKGGAGGKAERAIEEAAARVVAVSGRVVANVGPVVDKVGAGVRAGLGKVSESLREDAAASMPAELLAQADLPELSAGDALASLATRLDREADFWRVMSMRQLARAAWTERLGLAGAVALVVGGAILAGIAGFRALFAVESGGTVPLVATGMGALLTAAIAVSLVVAHVRRGQLEAQREALHRADVAELRLHRIALLLTLRERAPDAFVAAVCALDVEVRAAA
jgi:hypothetical protein